VNPSRIQVISILQEMKIDVAIAGIDFDQGLALSKITTWLRGDCHRSAGTENACRYGNGEAR